MDDDDFFIIPEEDFKDFNEIIHNIDFEIHCKKSDEKKKAACTGNCGMNYCDENGCVERKRNNVEIFTHEDLMPGEAFPESRTTTPQPPAIARSKQKGGSHE
jgi:hypothetical protein